MADTRFQLVLLCLVSLAFLVPSASAFGAGNIASISRVEGHNWRHGDIEDMLKTVAFIKGHKWTSMVVKRVYFGNWLRDYSQAVDVGTLKGVQADTIRVLVWVLSFMSFGYATAEFEVTNERLGVYRPEEHIDNPKDYADNKDARQFDQRLRGPVLPAELEIDPRTAMKNYIANEQGGWATSAGYVKYSFARSIHYGRLYTSGNNKGREEDLAEALRCLGQGLHCLEDFGAHTNYTELALREIGYHNVFPHVGVATEVNVNGKRIFPLVTGTFGGVDFLHSVLGEATDHVTQSEVEEMDSALTQAANQTGGGGSKGFGGSGGDDFFSLLAQVPGTGGLVEEAHRLQADSQAESARSAQSGVSYGDYYDQGYGTARADPPNFAGPPGAPGGPPGPNIPGSNIDPQAAIKKIYPLLEFRDKVVRTISGIVSKIPGLESLIEKISEKVTLFIMGLLAPYIKPIIAAASNSLKQGSTSVVDASAHQQYLVWQDPHSSDPTHSLLSKDHFSNILNGPAGEVAAEILKYIAPRVLYAWDHPQVPEHEVLNEVHNVFHHPALRNMNNEVQRNMFKVVEKWAHSYRKHDLNQILSSDSVKAGKNHGTQTVHGHGSASHSATAGGPLAMFGAKREIGAERANEPDSVPSAYDPAYGQPQQPAGFQQGDSTYAYQTAYQQGYEIPYDQQQQQQPPPQEGYGQPGYDSYGQQQERPQESYGYGYSGHNQGGYGQGYGSQGGGY
ncbi:heterokaryon incompatibility Het-C [Polychaeton citri CBS 116435]|uniref:Heterokaryon incompatibility Het-C n=1 Tax=Polychaeton citri CBS 116435 TaxID=1314669 RepID=A0A9P4QJ91_9PEZI|nr:heterokaryon incompatibility Het-C [Polychaeton citri CBS 116435]